MDPISAFCLTFLGIEFLWFSRLMALIHGPIASLGAVPPAGALLVSAIDGYAGIPMKTVVLLYSFMAFTIIWMVTFYLNTGMIGDLRSFANIWGLLCFFYFNYCFKKLGIDTTLNLLFLLAMAYIVIYVAISFVGPSSSFPGAFPTVILKDPVRGTRLYAASALIAFALIRQVHQLVRGQNVLVNVPALAVTLLAVYYQSSRVSTALYVIITGLAVFASKGQRRLAINVTLLAFCGYVVVAMLAEPTIADIIGSFNDATMSLRLQTFGIAYQNFIDNPVWGLGLPSDPAFYQSLFGPLYFPEDLGVLGLIGSYGIVGFAWTLSLALMLKKAVTVMDRVDSANVAAVSHAAIFGIMTLFFSQNIFQGDGGVMSSAALALEASLLRLGAAARQRTAVRDGDHAERDQAGRDLGVAKPASG